jgi:hypothetical protein
LSESKNLKLKKDTELIVFNTENTQMTDVERQYLSEMKNALSRDVVNPKADVLGDALIKVYENKVANTKRTAEALKSVYDSQEKGLDIYKALFKVFGIKSDNTSKEPVGLQFLKALRNSEFSDGFKKLFLDLAKNNLLDQTKIYVKQGVLQKYATRVFSDGDVLINLPDIEVKFLLDNLYDNNSLQIKTAEELHGWITIGFPMLYELAIRDDSDVD